MLEYGRNVGGHISVKRGKYSAPTAFSRDSWKSGVYCNALAFGYQQKVILKPAGLFKYVSPFSGQQALGASGNCDFLF